MKYFNSYDDHIKNIEGFIRTTKDQITSEINEAIETYTKALSLERDSIIDKLDNYLSVYKINFFNVKEVVDALHFFVSKCRYYSNENNLKVRSPFTNSSSNSTPSPPSVRNSRCRSKPCSQSPRLTN